MSRKTGYEEVEEVSHSSRADSEEHWPPLDEPVEVGAAVTDGMEGLRDRKLGGYQASLGCWHRRRT